MAKTAMKSCKSAEDCVSIEPEEIVNRAFRLASEAMEQSVQPAGESTQDYIDRYADAFKRSFVAIWNASCDLNEDPVPGGKASCEEKDEIAFVVDGPDGVIPVHRSGKRGTPLPDGPTMEGCTAATSPENAYRVPPPENQTFKGPGGTVHVSTGSNPGIWISPKKKNGNGTPYICLYCDNDGNPVIGMYGHKSTKGCQASVCAHSDGNVYMQIAKHDGSIKLVDLTALVDNIAAYADKIGVFVKRSP